MKLSKAKINVYHKCELCISLNLILVIFTLLTDEYESSELTLFSIRTIVNRFAILFMYSHTSYDHFARTMCDFNVKCYTNN